MQRLAVAILLALLLAATPALADLLLLGVGSSGGTPPAGCILVQVGSKLLNTAGSCILVH